MDSGALIERIRRVRADLVHTLKTRTAEPEVPEDADGLPPPCLRPVTLLEQAFAAPPPAPPAPPSVETAPSAELLSLQAKASRLRDRLARYSVVEEPADEPGAEEQGVAEARRAEEAAEAARADRTVAARVAAASQRARRSEELERLRAEVARLLPAPPPPPHGDDGEASAEVRAAAAGDGEAGAEAPREAPPDLVPPPSRAPKARPGAALPGKAAAPAPPPPAKPRLSVAPPPPPPAKGKGKAPGVAPPAKGKAAIAKARAPDVGGDSGAKLVKIRWSASAAPKPEDITAKDDPYLRGVVEFLPKWGRSRVERCEQHMAHYERAVGMSNESRVQHGEGACDDLTPRVGRAEDSAAESPAVSVAAGASPSIEASPTVARWSLASPLGALKRRLRRRTVFNTECVVEELSEHKLQEFFQARSAAYNIGARQSIAGVRKFITNEKHVKILDMMVGKERISRYPKLPQQVGLDSAVDDLIEAVRSCDYSRCTAEMLEDLRKIAMDHMEEKHGETIVAYIEARGPGAFQRLEHPHLHRLLHGVLTVPAVTTRLECMILESTYREQLEHSLRSLDHLHVALEALQARAEPLRRLFGTALRLGNALNRGSNAPVAAYGFRLSSLAKFVDARSPLHRGVSLLHCLVLWTRPEDLSQLCDAQLIEALAKARAASTHNVFQGLVQQLDSFRNIKRLVETGKYRGQDIPKCTPQETLAASEGDGAPPPESAFHVHMQRFLQANRSQSTYLLRFGRNMLGAYRALGAYLGDLDAVYPPPPEGKEDRMDLFAFFHHLCFTLSKTVGEVEQMDLAAELSSTLKLSPPCAGGDGAGPVEEIGLLPASAPPSHDPGGPSAEGSGAEVRPSLESFGEASHPAPQGWQAEGEEARPPSEDEAEREADAELPAHRPSTESASAGDDTPSVRRQLVWGSLARLDDEAVDRRPPAPMASPVPAPVVPPPVSSEPPKGPPPRRPAKAAGRLSAHTLRLATPAASPVLSGAPPPPVLRQLSTDCSTPTPLWSPMDEPGSPRTRLGRKSLTRIANRVSDVALHCGEISPRSRTSEAEDLPPLDVSGDDLTSQLAREMRRRLSRGRSSPGGLPGGLLGSPNRKHGGGGSSLLGSPARRPWLDFESAEDSPLHTSGCGSYYPLTPVKEHGETPFRDAATDG